MAKLIVLQLASLPIVCLFLLGLLNGVNGVCNETVITECNANMTYLVRNPISSEDQRDAYCGTVNELCANTLTECSCAPAGSTNQTDCFQFLGVKDATQYICNSTTDRAIYLQYRSCIMSNADALVASCKSADGTCTGANKAFQCFYDGMVKACNSEAALVSLQIQIRRFKPTLANANCAIDTSWLNSDAALNSKSSTLMFVCAALSLVFLSHTVD